MSFDSLLVESLVESPIGANETQNSTFVCSSCCALYTARIKLDPFGYNSIRFFSGVNLFVATITIIIATLLVGRQQKRRPDISTFQRKLMLFVIGLIVISMIGGILPITMASIVVAYGYHNAVPWPLWLVASMIAASIWSVAWFICYVFYFTPHRTGWKKVVGPPLVVFFLLTVGQFLGSELGRGDNVWWGYVASECILMPFFIFFFVNAFMPIGPFYPRPVLRYWAGYLTIFHALYLATYILVVRDSEAQYCIAIAEEIVFSSTFAIVIYFVLRWDGQYLAEETAPLLDMYKEGTLNVIPWDELQIEKDIKGAGTQGTVYKAQWGSEAVAIKKIIVYPHLPEEIKYGSGRGRLLSSHSKTPDEEEALASLAREASYLVELRHPSIVQFYGITKIPGASDTFGLVTKYMEHNLFSVIQEQVISQATPIAWSTRLKWIRDLAFGLRYLHHKSINHGDIKSQNVLLSADLQSCQICDFGSAGRTATAHLHTPQWSAPEVLAGGIYTKKSDVYSFGVLLWEIVTFHHPYERNAVLDAQKLIREGQTPLLLLPDLIPTDTPEVILKLMEATTRRKPFARPTMDTVCTSLSSTTSNWMLLNEDACEFDSQDLEAPVVDLEDPLLPK